MPAKAGIHVLAKRKKDVDARHSPGMTECIGLLHEFLSSGKRIAIIGAVQRRE
jgi:hypothetical protein